MEKISIRAQKISSNDLWSLIGSLCMKIESILTEIEVDENRKINCVDILKGALCPSCHATIPLLLSSSCLRI